jgi:hypothetical protein
MSTRAHSQKQTHFPHNVNSHAHTAQHHKHAPCAVEEGVEQGGEAGGHARIQAHTAHQRQVQLGRGKRREERGVRGRREESETSKGKMNEE